MEANVLRIDPAAEPDELDDALNRLRRMVEESKVPEARVYVKQLVHRWRDDARVQHWHEVLEPPRVIRKEPGVGRSYRAEWDWVRAHAGEYPGCWLAVYGDQLLAADRDPNVVRQRVRDHPEQPYPLLHFEPERPE